MSNILIVDDDPQLRKSFEKLLITEGHIVETSSTAEAGISIVKRKVFDLVIMDVRLPGMNGIEAFQVMHKLKPKLPVIIMTAYSTTEIAIEATKMGAFDYVLKPFEIPKLLVLIEQALSAGRFMQSRVEINLMPEKASSDAIIGRSQSMQEVYKAIGHVASTNATILIRGESGTGKELIARAIYQHGLRSEKFFKVINCVAIPGSLLESELFGYEKGAFTGAISRRVGKIEQAHHGTLFLDEIGDMSFNTQAKILRLLQEKSIERVGGNNPISIDVQIIAATNRNLEEAVSKEQFREDLYYRLKVVTIWLPPLRDRKDDIYLLANFFLSKFSRDMDIDHPGLTDEAKTALNEYHWPGNVRELSNTIQKALIFSRECPIGREDISRAIEEEYSIKNETKEINDKSIGKILQQWISQKFTASPEENQFDSFMDFFASAVVREALNSTGGNRTQAAKLLGLSRPTLLAKIEKYGLKFETFVS